MFVLGSEVLTGSQSYQALLIKLLRMLCVIVPGEVVMSCSVPQCNVLLNLNVHVFCISCEILCS